jgi:hypothetical protein
MSERGKDKIVNREVGDELRKNYLQAGIIPEAIDTVVSCVDWLENNPRRTVTPYGHGVGMLAMAIACGEGMSPEEQREQLKQKAELLVQKYGDHIIDFIRPELREALGITSEVKG